MITSTNGSIAKEVFLADDYSGAEILRTRLQEKQDELLDWVNEWHLVDLHALIFTMETTLTMLRSQLDPLQKALLEDLHATFSAVGGSMMVPKRRNGNDT